MRKIKLTPTQKAKLKGVGKKALDAVRSGKVATATGQLTRFTQGKPVIIKNPNAKGTTKTVQILGYAVPQNYVIAGGLGLALVGVAIAKHKN